ncbi:MAG: hydroxyethylthiazole kinase, partial [Raoultibacter sp.]
EVKALAGGASTTRGVDVCPDDAVTRENLASSAAFARDFALKTNAVVAITGAIDIVTDGKLAYAISNGSQIMGKITGAGCMLTCLCAAYAC